MVHEFQEENTIAVIKMPGVSDPENEKYQFYLPERSKRMN
jgi:hypothetical protein